jgi:hypothetical protein
MIRGSPEIKFKVARGVAPYLTMVPRQDAVLY